MSQGGDLRRKPGVGPLLTRSEGGSAATDRAIGRTRGENSHRPPVETRSRGRTGGGEIPPELPFDPADGDAVRVGTLDAPCVPMGDRGDGLEHAPATALRDPDDTDAGGVPHGDMRGA